MRTTIVAVCIALSTAMLAGCGAGTLPAGSSLSAMSRLHHADSVGGGLPKVQRIHHLDSVGGGLPKKH